MSQSTPTVFKIPRFKEGISLQPKKDFIDLLKSVKGTNLFTRYYPADEYVRKAEDDGLWFEKRSLIGAPLNQIAIKDSKEQVYKGLNFASNNYLGLASHPFTIEAGIEAGEEFGVNSAGSPLAFGATKYYAQLRQQIGDFLNASVLIFSSAWMACFGFVKSLAKDYDHILLDEECDSSLFEGARYTTKSVHTFKHLDAKDLEAKLTNLRKSKKNGILVVTDCLFNNDSSSPDLIAYQRIAAENQSYLVLNIGHDFACLGPNGRGVWEQQGLTELQNVFFIGSGSKSLGVNFGFIALPGAKGTVAHFWKYFCSTYMFTNAINPIQSNCGLATLRMARSQLGNQLRSKVLANASYLREKLSSKGFQVLGRVSPFVCVRIGNEVLGRIIVRIMMENGVFVNMLEYPQANSGEANIRMSMNPDHTQEQLDRLIDCLQFSTKAGNEVYQLQLARAKGKQTAKL